ncbi:hypothetical protein DPMN_192988 [Dreissena polymorpha]|uniref:Uncharacterized protein n=1 Tax=Dreissena polymorpha TaxID=45954 RepID=A0A9D3Y0M8_DREPO|nr:hypothetical protein DPMN_192988 [Dreissena polymorpha]
MRTAQTDLQIRAYVVTVNRKSIPDKKAGQPVVRQVRVKPLITSKTFDPAPSEKKELQSIHALLDKMASDATPKGIYFKK